MKSVLPRPMLSAVVAIFWILLWNDISVGAVAMGIIVGLVVPLITGPYWPDSARLSNPMAVFGYVGVVIRDIVVANFQVAYLVLFRRGDTLRSQFVTVPLDLTSAEAISVLSGTITLTPGTLTADVSADGRALLVHCLETQSPEDTVAEIKTRYEARITEFLQ